MTSDPTKALPGPWEVVWLKGDRLRSPSEICVAGTCNRVAFLASNGSLGTARLIAAAPDMLDALKAAKTFIADEFEVRMDSHTIGGMRSTADEDDPILAEAEAALKIVQDAIEKAEGYADVAA